MAEETTHSDRPLAGITDDELAELCRDHDRQAFQELMARYMSPIYNFSRQYVRSADETEDVTQETFFKVWKYIARYTKGRSFRPWIYTIARNTALDHIKKKRAVSFSELDDPENDLSFSDTLEDPLPLQAEIFEKAAMVQDLSKHIEGIHPNYRTVIILHYEQNMTFEEIAEIIGQPMNTVKSWHRRAVIRLRDLIDQALHQEGSAPRTDA